MNCRLQSLSIWKSLKFVVWQWVNNDIPLLELQRLMRKFLTDSSPMTADDYVQIDRQEETGQNLCDTDILDIVRTDEVEKSDNETPDSDAFQPDVTLKEDQSSPRL